MLDTMSLFLRPDVLIQTTKKPPRSEVDLEKYIMIMKITGVSN